MSFGRVIYLLGSGLDRRLPDATQSGPSPDRPSMTEYVTPPARRNVGATSSDSATSFDAANVVITVIAGRSRWRDRLRRPTEWRQARDAVLGSHLDEGAAVEAERQN